MLRLLFHLSLALLAQAASVSPALAVAALKGVLPSSQLALPGTALYEELNDSYLSDINSEIDPAAIFLPKNSAEVALFVTTIKPFALNGVAPFAVRGGGQQPAPACNNIQSGITIDLRNLTGVSVENCKDCVTIGAGERYDAVYKKLQPLGLATAGGRSAANGIGGLVLAGGLSFFSSREGFIIDNVLSFEVVLASGKIVNANSSANTDLYRALRGGGNNFGIVTKVTMKTFAQGPFWGGSVYYFVDSFPSQVEALVTELKKPDASPETHLMVSVGYSAMFAELGGVLGLNQLYYTQDVEKPAVLSPFADVQPQLDALNTMRRLDLVGAASEQLSSNTNSMRVAYMNCHVLADVDTLKAAYTTYLDGIKPLYDAADITLSFTLQPYPVSLLKKTDFQGGNSLGLDASKGPIVSVLFLTWWSSASDDDRILTTLHGLLDKIKADSTARGTAIPYVYMNYAHTFQDPITSYGAGNKKKLQDASKKYDPEGLFQQGVPGGFKLFV